MLQNRKIYQRYPSGLPCAQNVMEDKLNELMNDGDYYSAHQLILSLTKRKVKVGKINEAVEFVKNGVTRLCQANQFASASDAAMSIFEYANDSNFTEMKAMFSQLLNSQDSHHWRNFLNEMGKEGFLDEEEKKAEILNSLFESSPAANSDKLSTISSVILQVSGETRQLYLKKLAECLTSERENSELLHLHNYFIVELSLNLSKECQFFDNEYFLKAISSILNKDSEQADTIAPVEAGEYRLFNFCVLINYLCQRKSPSKALFTEILNEYLPEADCKMRPDMNRLRLFAENALGQTFWPAPKSRPGAGGPPADLMNMLQGLLGPQMRR